MKLKESFFYTIRENIKDEESVSGNLLVRSGMVKKIGNGIYMYMPLGFKVLKNIENIIREEMNKTGATELLMPNLLPEEVYINSGRRDNFGSNMFSLKDRYDRSYVLGPTHEEFFLNAASMKIKSYKDMPFNLYQIGNKYRDETRPRFGLIRVREFFMKDAYSFDMDEKGLDISYHKMFEAYKKIFDRIGINYKIVTADTGLMGGTLSEEFQALSNTGEDILVTCDCGYASNIEVSMCTLNHYKKETLKSKELCYTPNYKTIKEISKFLNEEENKFVKTLIYKANDKLYACLIPGDRELNETKLSKIIGECHLAEFEEVEKVTQAKVGFAGPIGLDIPIIADIDIKEMTNFIVGANKTDYHYKNVNINDFICEFSDIKNIKENDACPKCGKPVKFMKGIEIGNTFKLGSKYSVKLGLNYLDQNNKLQPVLMGCYGIGLGRIMASIIEQQNDEKGIIWPLSIAPYKVCIILANNDYIDEANKLYNELTELNIDTILDDRDERIGVKFNDMELIGIPFRITIGKKMLENQVELKSRNNEIDEIIDYNKIIEKLKELI